MARWHAPGCLSDCLATCSPPSENPVIIAGWRRLQGYTGLTGKDANFLGIRFMHLRLPRRNPFDHGGLRAYFRLGSARPFGLFEPL
jgi:hypothetical protein